jgi:hypothetical protein
MDGLIISHPLLIPSKQGFDQTVAYGYKMEENNPEELKETIFGIISLNNILNQA